MLPIDPAIRDPYVDSPLLVFYEVTRACDLACRHCRACAKPDPHPGELNHEQSIALIRQLATFPKPPLLVLTGGDPVARPDLTSLIREARDMGMGVAVTPAATPRCTPEVIRQIRDAGTERLAVSLDASTAEAHDAFRGVPGSFDISLRILEDARALDMPTQVNTTITLHNQTDLDAMAHILADAGICLWSVFFLVPVGRGRLERRLTPAAYEAVFERLWRLSRTMPFAIKTTEAPHYRRHVLQHSEAAPAIRPSAIDLAARPINGAAPMPRRAPVGVNDGCGVMFVSHTGQIFPSGFLPIECGRFPRDSVVDVYQNAPLFRQLRDADQLKGKCRACEYRWVCGGSRARSYALTRDPLASEPDCAYIPAALRQGESRHAEHQ